MSCPNISSGIINSSFKSYVTVKPSSEWWDSNTLVYNKAANLLDFNVCDGCRWLSSSYQNSYIIFLFQKEFVLSAYSMEALSFFFIPHHGKSTFHLKMKIGVFLIRKIPIVIKETNILKRKYM